ncbi:Tfp pilus assembly protein FimT/FimU [Francisella philomiragia]|uniref:pilus assembly FimT family protein n=1 Tax=Francisella philomiragia TaxID=28110 RepID=UPI00351554A1
MIKKYINAFSLVELMIVIVILTILALSATSFLKSDKYNQENQIEEIFDLIKKSRISAFQNNENVIICSSSDGVSCSSNSLWTDHLVIAFISKDGTSNYDSQNDSMIGSVESPNSSYYYEWSSFPNASFIRIASKGDGMNGVLTFCQDNQAYKKMLINFKGNISIQDSTDNNLCTA